LHAVGQLAEEQLLPFLECSALGDVAGALQGELGAVDRLELDGAFDGDVATVLGDLTQLAAPAAGLEQLLTHRSEGRTGDLGLEQLLLVAADRLSPRITVELFASAVPFDDAAVELPDEDRRARKLDQPLLLAKLALALAQRLLDLEPVGHVDE